MLRLSEIRAFVLSILSVLKWHKLTMVMDWKIIYLLSLLQMTFLVAPIRYKHSFRNILYIKFKIRQVMHLHQQETDYIRKTEYVINIETEWLYSITSIPLFRKL